MGNLKSRAKVISAPMSIASSGIFKQTARNCRTNRYGMEYHDAISSRSLCGTCYLTSLYYNPIIETLVKIGMSHLVTDVVSEKIKIHDEQKRIWQKLGLSKANFEFAISLVLMSTTKCIFPARKMQQKRLKIYKKRRTNYGITVLRNGIWKEIF